MENEYPFEGILDRWELVSAFERRKGSVNFGWCRLDLSPAKAGFVQLEILPSALRDEGYTLEKGITEADIMHAINVNGGSVIDFEVNPRNWRQDVIDLDENGHIEEAVFEKIASISASLNLKIQERQQQNKK